MTLMPGRLYRYTHDRITELVEFAYMGQTGKAIVHPPGEPGTQSSWAVDKNRLKEIGI